MRNEIGSAEDLIRPAITWARHLRAEVEPVGQPLSDEIRQKLESFFRDRILLKTKIHFVPVIPNPSFYDLLPVGTPLPFDLTILRGLTIDSVILLAETRIAQKPPPLSLIFHELVHVVQYDLLAIDEFFTQYITGWFRSGREYRTNPLEKEAYELQARFEEDPSEVFSVCKVVA